jgi:hypothetical protein
MRKYCIFPFLSFFSSSYFSKKDLSLLSLLISLPPRYGQPAGEFTEDSFHTVGNVLEVNTNVRSLATKRLIKNTVKQTGKQVMLERSDQSKSPKNSKSVEKEPKPSDKPEKGYK